MTETMAAPKGYDPSAIGSDVARSRTQYWARRFAALFVRLCGLNRSGLVATEIVQQIQPVCRISTKKGDLLSRGGHGRLRWRAETFYTEEPETIQWLESMDSSSVFWDVGANVGLYSNYAALMTGCTVLAVEPESQNFALLVDNIALNRMQSRIEPANFALTRAFGIGKLNVHAMTKGGAYNHFSLGSSDNETLAIRQVQFGVSMDELVERFGFAPPTHIKIDVDGNEPDIIEGGARVLQNPGCRSVLIEIQKSDPRCLRIADLLREYGYELLSERSNWQSRANREREQERPAANMIFTKKSNHERILGRARRT